VGVGPSCSLFTFSRLFSRALARAFEAFCLIPSLCRTDRVLFTLLSLLLLDTLSTSRDSQKSYHGFNICTARPTEYMSHDFICGSTFARVAFCAVATLVPRFGTGAFETPLRSSRFRCLPVWPSRAKVQRHVLTAWCGNSRISRDLKVDLSSLYSLSPLHPSYHLNGHR
jgi:hypothetical protein